MDVVMNLLELAAGRLTPEWDDPARRATAVPTRAKTIPID
jgi:hypothetical protein